MAVGLFFGLVIGLFFGFGRPQTALAWTENGEWFPDTLAGYTVQMNPTLTDPAGYDFVNKWWKLDTTTPSAPSNMPSGDVGTSLYAYFETTAAAGTSHPWFMYISYSQNFQGGTVPPISGIDYWARFGYDGYTGVTAWWGLKSGVSRPTINFYDTSTANDSEKLVTNHDFIKWVVANSDFRSRYGQAIWVNPIVVQDANDPRAFGWAQDTSSISGALRITRNGNQVQFYGVAPYQGTYYASDPGTYQFIWEYSLDGLSRSYSTGLYTVPDTSAASPVFNQVTVTSVGGGDYNIRADVSNTDEVWLQKFVSDRWVDVEEFNPSQMPIFIWGGTIEAGYMYQIKAYPQTGGEFRYYELQFNGGSGNDSPDLPNLDVSGYITTLVQWIGQLVNSIPDLFMWLPYEVRVVLFSALILMIILGVVGWLKS